MPATSFTSGAWPERVRRWVERRPLLWLACLALGAVLMADGMVAPGLALAGLVVVVLMVAGKRRLLAGALVVAAGAGCWHHHDLSQRRAMASALGSGRHAELELRLLEEPAAAGRGWAAVAGVVDGPGRVRLRAGGVAPARGAVVRASGRLVPPGGPRNPGEFDRRQWLDRRGVFAEMEGGGAVELVRDPPAWRRAAEGARSGFREAVIRGLDPLSREAAVIRAVVLGDRPGDEMLIEPFRFTGTLHVFAVSGLHVGMVGLLGWGILRLLGVPRRAALIPLVLMMFGYAWLTGFKPPAVRAAWMASVVLGAFWFRRRPDVANALGLAALLVLVTDGDLVFTAGVQLSFIVVGAIGLGHRPVSKLWAWMRREEPYLPRSLYGPWRERWLKLRRGTADSLTVSTSAWAGSAPLTVWHFGIVTPISVIASVVLSLLVLPMLGMALVSGALSPVPAVPEAINRLNAVFAGGLMDLAGMGSEIPGGHLEIPRDRPADEFLIVFDLEDDGAACWHGEGGSVMIDGGSRRSFGFVVMPALRHMALRPGSVVATHPDGGHVGGFIDMLDAFPVRRGLVPVQRALGTNYRDWIEAADGRDVPLVLGQAGMSYPLSDAASLEVIHAPDPWNWHDLADNRTMPVRLHWRGWRILFMGDAGWTTERRMQRAGIDFGTDVIVAGRHGHDLALGSAFLEASGARAIVASHADFPPDQRIPPTWRAACEDRGIAVFHQGESGAVSFTILGDLLRLEGFVDGRVVELER
ncbi:ComEC/Rec2 family competence protein [Haloferula sp. A504]|uniref:ComEC/Rec2 family competence protein n=1 Tax=Haloferula sp. A504 TaxID=3373601 RepID=UPI0031C9DAA8|nr:ComEC/Rec2 family competence protein [Verrucomicrobiaceae bacterium E54]